MTREPVLDHPHVELRVAAGAGDPVLAEIAFPATTAVVQAKSFLVSQLGEVLLRPCGECVWRTSGESLVATWPLLEGDGGEWVELEAGVRELIHGCGSAAFTAAIVFDRAGWTEEQAAAWLQEHLPAPSASRLAVISRLAGSALLRLDLSCTGDSKCYSFIRMVPRREVGHAPTFSPSILARLGSGVAADLAVPQCGGRPADSPRPGYLAAARPYSRDPAHDRAAPESRVSPGRAADSSRPELYQSIQFAASPMGDSLGLHEVRPATRIGRDAGIHQLSHLYREFPIASPSAVQQEMEQEQAEEASGSDPLMMAIAVAGGIIAVGGAISLFALAFVILRK